MASIHWESELASLLRELSETQRELLGMLTQKRDHLVAGDQEGLAAMQPREQALLLRLQECQNERARLLAQAASEGLPSDSIQSLTRSLPVASRKGLERQVQEAASRARILQHQSLANWVLVQRTLLHLSQLLEIIATGGRLEPTYSKGEPARAGGSLVDQAA